MKNIAQKGRSMVEMLGVLAIVGVLSVGAIAGYSKAMMKYKLNKQADAFRFLMYEAMKMSKQIDKSKVTANLDLLPLLKATNSIPHGYSSDFRDYDISYTDDVFGNGTWVTFTPSGTGSIGTNFVPTEEGYQSCRNLVNIAIENSANLYRFFTDGEVVDDEDISFETLDVYYGDSYCSESWAKCLKDITLTDTDTICNQCFSKYTRCRLYVIWK